MSKLLHGDCLEEMAKLPDNSIDLTVTSPPYDNLRTYNGNIDQWNEDVWKGVIQELYRVTKNGGVVVWVVGDATIKGNETGTSFKQALFFKECGFNLHDTMIYFKRGGLNSGSLQAYQQKIEYMFVFSKGKIKTFNLIKDRPNKHTQPRKKLKRQKDGTFKEQMVYTSKFGTRYNLWEYQTGKHHSTSYEEVPENDDEAAEDEAQDAPAPDAEASTKANMAKRIDARFNRQLHAAWGELAKAKGWSAKQSEIQRKAQLKKSYDAGSQLDLTVEQGLDMLKRTKSAIKALNE